MEFTFNAIGYLESNFKMKYDAPRQATIEKNNLAKIVLEPKQNFETALDDLKSFSHIWVIYVFHKNTNWKPKVLPPRNTREKKGVFATRAPYRPNPIGITVVKLLEIKGRTLIIEDHDLLDGTPILDIKPYLNYADSFPNASLGWIENLEEKTYKIIFNKEIKECLEFLTKNDIFLDSEIIKRLSNDPFPHPYRRITKFPSHYQMRFKEWACDYIIKEETVEIIKVYSSMMSGDYKESKNKKLHDEFNIKFK